MFAKHSKLLGHRLTSPRSIVDWAHAVKKGKSMFIELMPLIEKRTITITVAALKDGHVRVNVVPAARDSSCECGLGSAWPTERSPRHSPEAIKGTNNRHLRLVPQDAANE